MSARGVDLWRWGVTLALCIFVALTFYRLLVIACLSPRGNPWAGPQMCGDTDQPGSHPMRIVKLVCKPLPAGERDNDAWGYNDTELRIYCNDWKRVTRRNKTGVARKANTWYLNETVEGPGPYRVELWHIKIGFGVMNRKIAAVTIDPSKTYQTPGKIVDLGARYELHWESVLQNRGTTRKQK